MLNLELDGMPVKMETWCRRRHKTTFMNHEKNLVKNNFQEEALKRHNEYRMEHGCPSLVLDQVLTDYAKKWAQYLANTNHIHHSGQLVDGVKVGENIAVIYSGDPKEIAGKEVSDKWYSEIDLYDFKTGNGSEYAGHFTQMVWKETQQIGIAQAMSKDGRSIVVANYSPQGNIPGRYFFNVLPLSTQALVKDDDEPKAKNIDLTSIESALPEPPDNFAVPNCSPPDHKNLEELVEKSLSPVIAVQHFKLFPQSLETLVRECVESHNKYRALHSSPPLKICRSLTALAQEWSEKLTKDGRIQHYNRLYKGQHLGENFIYKWCRESGNLTGAQVADTWYSQMSKYDFSHTKHSMDTGHFTQMIWRNSKVVGIGKSKSLDGAIVVVAFYHPAGNIAGAFSINIHPPLKDGE